MMLPAICLPLMRGTWRSAYAFGASSARYTYRRVCPRLIVTHSNREHFTAYKFTAPIPLAFKSASIHRPNRRSIFMWVENIFNRVDRSRLNQAGPDRACVEFILRMGGAVKLEPFKPTHEHENESDWISKDTELPKHDRDNPLHVIAIDMRDSTLTEVGMEHFKQLKKLQRVDFSGSKYVSDDGMRYLMEGCPSLRQITLKDCPGVSDACIAKLKAAFPHAQIIKN